MDKIIDIFHRYIKKINKIIDIFRRYIKKKMQMRQTKLSLSIIVVFIIIYMIYLVGNFQTFTNYEIYNSFMSTIPFFGIIALPMTFVITLGLIDLSFPSVIAFAAWIFAILFKVTENIYLAALCCLLTGIFAGLLNSFLIVTVKIPSIVATIGTMFFWRGAVYVCAEGKILSVVKAKGTLLHTLTVGRLFDTIPAQAIWFVGLAIIFWLLLRRHKFGSHVLFVGDNEESAHMMGINVNRIKLICFVLVGFFAALSGMMSNFEYNSFYPSKGAGFLMPTLAAVFIGGTSVFGGEGTIFGTFIGLLIIGSLEAGIVSIGISGFWLEMIYGFIIILSVSAYSFLLRKQD